MLDFAWRPNRDETNSDMELITWSRDQTVRVWRLDETLQKLCDLPEIEDDGKRKKFFRETPIIFSNSIFPPKKK